MGEVKYPPWVKLIAGVIFSGEEFFVRAKDELAARYGQIDFESGHIPFKCTDYYREEMGQSLWRKFVSFKPLINPEKVVSVKLFTNRVEKKFFFPGTCNRRVNIDPGYLNLAKLILATTKDYAHRVYLGKGIYAEVTLRYFKDRGFQPWRWTYPDYKSREYLDIFNFIRRIYRKQLQKAKEKNERKSP